jgi:hypothetical protein
MNRAAGPLRPRILGGSELCLAEEEEAVSENEEIEVQGQLVRRGDRRAEHATAPERALADHPADERCFDSLSGQQAYKCFACRVAKA